MKLLQMLLILLFSYASVIAQQLPLLVKTDKNGTFFLEHTVGPKENFYSIGRIYNISPRVYAPYNNLELSSTLSIGQVLRIPLNEVNFYQGGLRNENEVVVPLYHVVKSGETLQRISQQYGSAGSNIQSWNNLRSEALAPGQRIIIGFLKVDKNLSPLAAQGMPVRSEPNTVLSPAPAEQPKVEKPASAIPETKPEAPSQQSRLEERNPQVYTAVYNGVGYFMSEYNAQTNNGKRAGAAQTFKSGVFKSNSGWEDGKYYVLMEGVERGTIVKIINPANGKMIYAKVLAGVEETSPGSGLQLRISNAAAAQLGIYADTFTVDVAWAK